MMGARCRGWAMYSVWGALVLWSLGGRPPLDAAAVGDAGSAVALAADESGPGRAPAAAASRFVDNGDGTVSDIATGLMWEKKCRCDGSLHDFRRRYAWSGDGSSDTIWDWLDDVNAEGGSGFAGYDDWRIPNAKEFLSIADHARSRPAVATAFDDCPTVCTDARGPGCSCTAAADHWTSTTFSDFTPHAMVLGFRFGFVDDRTKTNLHHVRAVRGGS